MILVFFIVLSIVLAIACVAMGTKYDAKVNEEHHRADERIKEEKERFDSELQYTEQKYKKIIQELEQAQEQQVRSFEKSRADYERNVDKTISDLQNKTDKLEKRAAGYLSTIESLQSENDKYRLETSKQKSQLKKYEHDIEDYRSEISQKSAEIDTLQVENQNIGFANSEQRLRIKKLTIEIEDLKSENAKQTAAIRRLEERLGLSEKEKQQFKEESEQSKKESESFRKKAEFYANITSASEGLNESGEPKDDITVNDLDKEQKAVFDMMMNTDRNMFITGKAGTGKSALLRIFSQQTQKCVLKVAPTGISAINIEGDTIHSVFGFDNISKRTYDKITAQNLGLNDNKLMVLENASAIIIDEISMVRADVLEKIDIILKIIAGNNAPFGGKQMLFFGDAYQLPPVIDNKDEMEYLKNIFGGIYFFNSFAYKEGNFHFVELTINHRQASDNEFYQILNSARLGRLTSEQISILNSRVNSDDGDLMNVTRLFSKKLEAEKFNKKQLGLNLEKVTHSFEAKIIFPEDGIYPTNSHKSFEASFPISKTLNVKKGSLVMFVKNNGKQWANGTLGIVSDFHGDKIIVSIDNKEYDVHPTEFEQLEAKYKNKRITYEVSCRVVQYPIVLAYAMTIHKAQGQTYGRVACDISGEFAPGQAYVALSRVKRLDGLFLLNKVRQEQFKAATEVRQFYFEEKIKPFLQDEKIAQKYRRAFASSSRFDIVGETGGVYRIRSGRNEYLTSLSKCSCESFKYDKNRNSSPCKHIYWLARYLGELPTCLSGEGK